MEGNQDIELQITAKCLPFFQRFLQANSVGTNFPRRANIGYSDIACAVELARKLLEIASDQKTALLAADLLAQGTFDGHWLCYAERGKKPFAEEVAKMAISKAEAVFMGVFDNCPEALVNELRDFENLHLQKTKF